MSIVTLFCADTPGLKLGPGLPNSDRVIAFAGGYAEVDENDPIFAEKMSWIGGPGCPSIRVLDAGEVPSTDPNAVACPVCKATFGTDKQLNGHILGAHRAKKG